MGARDTVGAALSWGIDRCPTALNLFFPGDVKFKPSRPIPHPELPVVSIY